MITIRTTEQLEDMSGCGDFVIESGSIFLVASDDVYDGGYMVSLDRYNIDEAYFIPIDAARIEPTVDEQLELYGYQRS